MSVFDDLLSSIFNVSWTSRRSRRVRRLDELGERVPGTIYAIDYSDSAEHATFTWGVDVRTSDGPLRATVRQWLQPHPEHATLGADVVVAHLDGRVAIDWRATLAARGIHIDTRVVEARQLRRDLAPGIRDSNVDRLRVLEGVPALATVRRAERARTLGMTSDAYVLELDVRTADGAYATTLERERVPSYAATRFGAGTGAELPAAHRRGNPQDLTIDWETFGGGSSLVRGRA